jgi:hypothetical protein
MIYLADWKEIVGEAFMSTFIRIEQRLRFAKDEDPWKRGDNAKDPKITNEEKEEWKKKRRLMRFCGYETNPEDGKWDSKRKRGWIGSPRFPSEGVLVFGYFGIQREMTVVSLGKFLDMKRAFEAAEQEEAQARDEEEYYSTKPLVDQTIQKMEEKKPKQGNLLDDDCFVPEVEVSPL